MQPEFDSKGLTKEQSGIVSIKEAWRLSMPWAEPPSVSHLLGWVRIVPELGIVLSIIDDVANNGLARSPSHVVYPKLQRISAQYEVVQDR